MSTTTTPSPSTTTKGKRKRKRRGPRIVHVFHRVDIEMSDALGIPARALCGRWMHPGTDHRDGRISPSGERLCGRCANTRVYRGLD